MFPGADFLLYNRVEKDRYGIYYKYYFEADCSFLNISSSLLFNHRGLVSLVGKVPIYRAGGLGSIPGPTNTQGLKEKVLLLLEHVRMTFASSRIRTGGPLLHIFIYVCFCHVIALRPP